VAITIGNEPDGDFNDPIRLLEDCHRRIENFLDVLMTLANQSQGNVLATEQHTAAEISLRYFREAGPKHAADEEESLFPRIRASQNESAKELLNLDHLHTDHITADKTIEPSVNCFISG
jgi:iron-sulfur cluster repair protein YtfE (RIC family)